MGTAAKDGVAEAEDAAAEGAARSAAGDEAEGAAKGGAACRGHSFDPDTRVVMADGVAKPIGDVNVGDQVLATDPVSGLTVAEPVAALHVNHDVDMTDLTVLTSRTSRGPPAQAAPASVSSDGKDAKAGKAGRKTVAGGVSRDADTTAKTVAAGVGAGAAVVLRTTQNVSIHACGRS